jgi:hypothetical protein
MCLVLHHFRHIAKAKANIRLPAQIQIGRLAAGSSPFLSASSPDQYTASRRNPWTESRCFWLFWLSGNDGIPFAYMLLAIAGIAFSLRAKRSTGLVLVFDIVLPLIAVLLCGATI